jgi:chromosome segregation ATPase
MAENMYIPPLRAAGLDVEEIEDRRKELRDLGKDLNMAEAELMTLESRIPQMRRLDAEMGAAARRAGKKDPGPRLVKELEAKIEATERERDILVAAIEAVEVEIANYVSERAEELIGVLRNQEAELNGAQLAAISTLEAARNRRHTLVRAASWIAQFIPPEEEAAGGPPQDRFEVVDPHAHRRDRPSDLEIARVLAYLRSEAGGDVEVVMEAQDFAVAIDGRASLAHSFDRRIAAIEAETSAAAGGAGDDAA